MKRLLLLLQEGDSSMSGSIEWEDFLIMMKPVVEQEYRRDAEAMLKDTPVACREAAEVRKRRRGIESGKSVVREAAVRFEGGKW